MPGRLGPQARCQLMTERVSGNCQDVRSIRKLLSSFGRTRTSGRVVAQRRKASYRIRGAVSSYWNDTGRVVDLIEN